MGRRRWLWIGVVGAILFALNVVGRLWIRAGSVEDEAQQDLIGLYAFIAIGLAMAVAAVLWGRRRPGGEVVADLAGAGVLGMVLSVVVGAFVSGGTPNDAGITHTMAQIGLFTAFAGGGALLGMLLLIMLGKDYRSTSLARFVEERSSKRHRVVRS
jgi:MFS family permease